VSSTPYLMKFLSIAGTVAMFLVGGGILAHGIPVLHHAIASMVHSLADVPNVGGVLASVSEMVLNGVLGVAAGTVCLLVATLVGRLVGKQHH